VQFGKFTILEKNNVSVFNRVSVVNQVNPKGKYKYAQEDVLAARRLLADSSKKLADLTASMVYDNPSLLKLLIEVSWLDQDPWSQRASRVVSICCCRYPEMFQPQSSTIISRLKKVHVESVIRNFLKILAEVTVMLKDRNKTQLLNLCFDYLTGNYSVAVKVYSMQILYNLSLEIPEIAVELSNILEESLPDASPGYRSRGEKILRKLHKINFL
jgi:hypothetical protein